MAITEDIVKGVDHLILMVGDLDKAQRTWQALGFHTTPRGYHSSGGTANHLVMLDRTYIELLGPASASADCGYRRKMEQEPGLAGIALRGSAADTYRYWQAQGLAPSPPESLGRDVKIDASVAMARFELTRLPPSAELPFLVFCCEQLTPQFVWSQGLPPHPNGAENLKELIIVVADAGTPDRLARVTGRPLRRGPDAQSLEVADCRITFLSRSAFERRFGLVPGLKLDTLPVLAGMVLASTFPSRARQLAEAAGWATEGVVIEWSQAI